MNLPKIFVALDYDNAASARRLWQQLNPADCGLKIGNELFTLSGPDLVREARDAGFRIFLDLKYHDIPNTVAKAASAACKLGVSMFTIHAAGGADMVRATREAVEASGLSMKPLILAVTVLTSFKADNLSSISVNQSIAEQVQTLATLATQSGATGLVCSAHEAAALRASLGQNIALVTPGIRMPGDAVGDQARVMTPQQALDAGASHLVIGRSITHATDPLAAVNSILASLT
jgi:orotidine-5'-phosphate decarboxylase